jgi:hypothetical protein
MAGRVLGSKPTLHTFKFAEGEWWRQGEGRNEEKQLCDLVGACGLSGPSKGSMLWPKGDGILA